MLTNGVIQSTFIRRDIGLVCRPKSRFELFNIMIIIAMPFVTRFVALLPINMFMPLLIRACLVIMPFILADHAHKHWTALLHTARQMPRRDDRGLLSSALSSSRNGLNNHASPSVPKCTRIFRYINLGLITLKEIHAQQDITVTSQFW